MRATHIDSASRKRIRPRLLPPTSCPPPSRDNVAPVVNPIRQYTPSFERQTVLETVLFRFRISRKAVLISCFCDLGAGTSIFLIVFGRPRSALPPSSSVLFRSGMPKNQFDWSSWDVPTQLSAVFFARFLELGRSSIFLGSNGDVPAGPYFRVVPTGTSRLGTR